MNWQNYKCLLVPMLGLVLAFTFCLTNPVAAEEEPQLNILTLREAFIKDGKMMEGIQFAKEITAYQNNKFPHRNVRVYFEIFGDVGKIYWVGEHKDLATMESQNMQLGTDPGFLAILGKAVGVFIEGRTHDTVMRLLR